MSPFGQAQKLGRSRSFSEGTGRAVTFANLRCEVPLAVALKSDAITGLEVSRAPIQSSDSYPPQSRSDGTTHRCYDEIARKVRSIPERIAPNVIRPAHETAPSQLPPVEKPSPTTDSASQAYVFPSFTTDILPKNSPFHDQKLLERLQIARYGTNMIDGRVTVDFSRTVAYYTGNNYQRCENIVTLMEVFCQLLESRRGIGETRIADVVEVLRGTSGWLFDFGADEVTHAWNLLYLLIAFPLDIVPITMSCGTIEEQIRMIFPPTPPRATPLKFKTTLSDILKAGLKVKPAVYFWEHLQIEKDGDDLTVRLMLTSPCNAGFYKSYLHNRAAKALQMEGWIHEIIGSTFALYGSRPYDMTAEDLKLFVRGTHEEFCMMRALFREFGNVPPKFLAHRAIELENLVRSRRAFWSTLRRDLLRQRKEQPFTFWGSILALLFGICTVIQTVASVWALVAAVQGNSPPVNQTMTRKMANGMRILGSPWLTCMTNEQLIDVTKENATISCLVQVGIQ